MRFMTSHKQQNHIMIESLRFQTKLQRISAFIKERKVKFFGHIKQSSEGLSKLILEGRAKGRDPGRPKHRWIDDTKTWIWLPSWYSMIVLTI